MEREPLLMGIDIGTSACKAAGVPLGRARDGQCSAGISVYYPEAGYVSRTVPLNGGPPAMPQCGSVWEYGSRRHCRDWRRWAKLVLYSHWSRGGGTAQNTDLMDMRCADLCAEINEKLGFDTIFQAAKKSVPALLYHAENPGFSGNARMCTKKTAYFLQSNSYMLFIGRRERSGRQKPVSMARTSMIWSRAAK